MQKHDYQYLLEGELNKRLEKNSSYSMRSFALALGISSSALSELLSGKRGISVKKAEQVLDRLNLSLDESNRFINSVKKTKARYNNTKLKQNHEDNYHQLTIDLFQVLSDWYHYSILNLVKLDCFKNNHRWIAKKLGITQLQSKLALERLFRLGLLEEKEGKVVRTKASLKSSDNIPSASLRKFHNQILEKAIQSLDKDSIDERDITSMTMAIDTKKIPEAKEKIKKFRRELSDFLEIDGPDRVYNLNIQLIPMDIKE